MQCKWNYVQQVPSEVCMQKCYWFLQPSKKNKKQKTEQQQQQQETILNTAFTL